MLDKIKEKAKSLKKEITALYYAAANKNIPWYSKALIVFTVAYALSPIDLIPDFIPVLGYLDDLLILPVLITITIKTIPNSIMEEARNKASTQEIKLKKNWLMAVLFIVFWLVIIYAIVNAIVKSVAK